MRPDYMVLLERDGDGKRAVIIVPDSDTILWITDTYPTAQEAETAALEWMQTYLTRLEARQQAMMQTKKTREQTKKAGEKSKRRKRHA
jgi:hypothetical protein